METDIDRLLASFVEMRREANVNACFGEPVTLEGRTVIPVAKTTYGFGMGAGRGPTTEADEGIRDADKIGPGAGGGARSSPLGVIEVTSQGARYESVVDRQRIALVSMLVGAWGVFWLSRALMAIFGRRE